MVLGLGEAHALILRITKLIGEDNHEVLAREVLLQLIGQTLKGVLIRDGTLSGGDYHEEMILRDACSELWQFVPMGHWRVFSPHVGMTVVDIFGNQYQRLVTPMELDATV